MIITDDGAHDALTHSDAEREAGTTHTSQEKMRSTD